jgi:hypothetical protein
MSEVIQLAQPVPKMRDLGSNRLPVRTDAVSVLFTTEEETLAAAHVAAVLARAMAVPLTIVHCRAVPYPLPVDAPVGVCPAESEEFSRRLQSEGIDARVRVFLCRDRENVVPKAFRGHSLIVVGGSRRWWPTASERWRRRLEAAGHFVLFADVREHAGSKRLEASCA